MNKDWLDIGVLEDYLDGKLDAKTMNRVEREALEDPFVAEALAGLSESPKRSLQSISLLQKQLHERIVQHQTTKKASVVTWQRLSIAAAAAVMFIAVSVMFWMRENNLQKELAGRAKKVDVTISAENPVTSADTPPAVAAAPVPVVENADQVKEKEIEEAIKAAKTNTYTARTKAKPVIVQDRVNSAPAAQQLNEVAVVGYVAQRKQSLTGSVSSVTASALSNVLSGKVVAQEDGKPLPGVSVSMRGTNFSTVTDSNGEFKINADTSVKAGVLRADYIGFNRAEMLAKANLPVNITLSPNNQQLNEMVVVGMAKKKEQNEDRIMIRGMSSISKNTIKLVSNPVGGWDKLFDYIKANNAFANEPATGQEVELSFKIDRKGNPADVKIIKGADSKYEQEAIRLIINGPKWEKPEKARDRMTFTMNF